MTIEDGADEHENETLLKEQNEMLKRRLKRLEQQIAIMSRSARRSCGLHSLDLSRNSIKDDGATSLATALKQSSSVVLRTLHLEHNPFTSSGSREIAKMARVNLSLTNLSFANYTLDNSALQALRVAFDFF